MPISHIFIKEEIILAVPRKKAKEFKIGTGPQEHPNLLLQNNEELVAMLQQLIESNDQANAARKLSNSIVETIPEPLVVLGKNLVVKSANNAFYQTFGISGKDSEGKSIYELGNQNWADSIKPLFKILPKERKLVNFEICHDLPGIGMRSLQLKTREIKSDGDNESLILLVIEDITERVGFQNSRVQLLQRFHDLVIQAPVAVCILKGTNHVVEIANTAYLELVGKTKSIIGKPLLKSLPGLKNQGVKELLDRVIGSGETYRGKEISLNFSKLDNPPLNYYDFVYQPLYESSKTASGIIVVLTKVTEQVQARKVMERQAAMVQELLMTAPGFVCMLEGPKHVYGLINERYQQLVGTRDIRNKSIMEALPELKGQGIEEVLNRVYKTGTPYVGIDEPIRLARDTGLFPELRYFNFSYQPMFNVNRKIYAILVFGYEVTEQVNAQNKIAELKDIHTAELEEKVLLRTGELLASNRELLKNVKELARKNKELESFNYISSHDLQEPLRKIQLFAGRILDTKHDAGLNVESKNHFKRIQAAAWRMQALLEDLISYSRAGITELTFENTDLNEIVNDVLEDLSEVIKDSKAVILVGQLCHAQINPSQFRQVINNVLANSLKYHQKNKPPHIKIRSTPVDGALHPELNLQPISYCHITVEDRGIGFEEIYSKKIFEVFQRLHAKGDYEGTGIGLAIVKKIVESHGGRIFAKSVANKGTVFHIYIPNRPVGD